MLFLCTGGDRFILFSPPRLTRLERSEKKRDKKIFFEQEALLLYLFINATKISLFV